MIVAPLIVGRKGEQEALIEELRAQGFVRLRIDGEVHEIDQLPKLDRNKKHTIEIVIDRLKVGAGVQQRLAESFETALRYAEDRAIAVEMGSSDGPAGAVREHLFSPRFPCPLCSYPIPEL